MLHLFLSDALGADLLTHLRTQPQFAGVVAELEAEFASPARHLPTDALPVLSVWYRGDAVDYYADAVADQLFAALALERQRIAPPRLVAATIPPAPPPPDPAPLSLFDTLEAMTP